MVDADTVHAGAAAAMGVVSSERVTERHRVRSVVQRQDIPRLADTLASAFEHDPFFQYLYGAKVTDIYHKNHIFFSAVLRSELQRVPQHSTIHVSHDDGCVAIWNHVGQWDYPESLDFLAAVFRVFGLRSLHVGNTINKLKQKHPTQPHMFLSVLGTHQQKQGKGSGSAVISEMLRQCDRDGTAVYVESSNERNVPFYQRHGFRLMHHIAGLPRDCPPIAALWREPQSPPKIKSPVEAVL